MREQSVRRQNRSNPFGVILLTVCLIISLIIIDTSFIPFFSIDIAKPAYALTPSPDVTASSAILIDAKTGEILYSKDIHKQEYPASMTKIITALLTLEHLKLDEIVTVDDKSPYTKGSKIALNAQEELSVEELMYALLIPSANDAAEALGVRISGSLEEFAKLMNSKAKELGAQNTNFVNPNGLHNPDHMTTAYDMAMIAREAMKNDEFRRFVSTYTHTIPPTNKQPKERLMHNTNRLLYDEAHKVIYNGKSRPIKYEDVTGIKTGYTFEAGYCLTAGAERDGMELIAVLMHSESDNARYLDAISLLEYGFDNYKNMLAVAAGTSTGAIEVRLGNAESTGTYVDEDIWITVPADTMISDIVKDVQLSPFLEAPVKPGDIAGVLKVKYKGVELAQADVFVSDGVSVGTITGPSATDNILHTVRNVVFSLLGVFLLLLLVYVLMKRRQIRIKRQRRAERAIRLDLVKSEMEALRRKSS